MATRRINIAGSVCEQVMQIAFYLSVPVISATMYEHVQSCVRCKAFLFGRANPSRN